MATPESTQAALDPGELKGRRLGRVLIKLKKVTREQVHEALQLQKSRKEPIGKLLVGLGSINEADVMEALAGQAGVIAPYPTLSEISKRVAGSYYTPALFGARTRKLVRALQWLG